VGGSDSKNGTDSLRRLGIWTSCRKRRGVLKKELTTLGGGGAYSRGRKGRSKRKLKEKSFHCHADCEEEEDSKKKKDNVGGEGSKISQKFDYCRREKKGEGGVNQSGQQA